MTVPLFIPARPRIGRKRLAAPVASPAPIALMLVSATYQAGEYVEMTFDRAVTLGQMDVTVVVVDDAVLTSMSYEGTGAGALVSPTTVRVTLAQTGPFAGPAAVYLTVGAENGIVAVNDAGTWAGVDDLELPFP